MSNDESTPTDPVTVISDARSLRVLAHPLRVALLDSVSVHGPITATDLAELVDDTPSNVSFHLRVLGNAGLIEQAPSEDARRRPWQAVAQKLHLEGGETFESRTVLGAVVDVMQTHAIADLRKWVVNKPDAPKAWQDAGFLTSMVLHMTADELASVKKQIFALLEPFEDRKDNTKNEPGVQSVRFSSYGHPVLPMRPETDPLPGKETP